MNVLNEDLPLKHPFSKQRRNLGKVLYGLVDPDGNFHWNEMSYTRGAWWGNTPKGWRVAKVKIVEVE